MFANLTSDLEHRLNWFRLLIALLLLFAATQARSDPKSPLQIILNEESLPGIAWATFDGSDTASGGQGYAQLDSARPIRATTRVQVGSVTKTLIALGVLNLVSQEKLHLDSSVELLLPELNWQNRWGDSAPVTVQHLLEHTAGIDNIRMWQFLNSAARADDPLIRAFPQANNDLLRIRTRPGRLYSYSNMGYALLGLLIERITSERYESYLERELLKPLGMHESSFAFITQDRDSRLAMGYIDNGVQQKSVPIMLRPAGQFTTTAQDMLHLLRFLLSDGSVDGKQIVAYSFMQRLAEPSTTDAFLAGLSRGHGLALAARDRHGVLGECHPGTTFGFRAYLCVFRAQGKAFFYAVNADSETADYERFTEYFIDRLNVASAVQQPAVPIRDLHSYTGLYKLAPANMAEFAWLDWMFNSVWLSVDHQRNGLLMNSVQSSRVLLLPLGDGLFRNAERTTASHVFLGPEGNVLSTGLTTWTKESPFKLVLGWLSLTTGLLGLLYVFFRGLWLVACGRIFGNTAILLPWLSLMSFALPVFLFSLQPFLKFGELTVASVLLAVLSGALPVSLMYALYYTWRSNKYALTDLCSFVAGTQLCVVLVVQGVLPIVFWC